MPMPFRVKLLVLLPALTAGTAVAADALLLPPENVKGNVRYMTGGVGFDEAEAMRQAASHYPLSIELAARPDPRDAYPRDVYLSNVRVDIRDEQGQSLIRNSRRGGRELSPDARRRGAFSDPRAPGALRAGGFPQPIADRSRRRLL